MAEIVVSVRFYDSSTTGEVWNKKVRIAPDVTVAQAVDILKEKVTTLSPTMEYLLFLPDQRMVMQDTKTLDSYGIEKIGSFDIRPRNIIVPVDMADGTTKKLRVDSGATVGEVLKYIGEKIDIKNVDEFGLQDCQTQEWLEPSLPFLEQFQPSPPTDEKQNRIAMKKRYFLDDANISKDDPFKLHYVYTECKNSILSGNMPCSLEEALELASLELQIEQGNIYKSYEAPGEDGQMRTYFEPEPDPQKLAVDEKQYLPPQYRVKTSYKTVIIEAWKKLIRTSDLDGKLRYVQIVRGLKTFGITFFPVKEHPPKGKPLDRFLGITRGAIIRMDAMKTVLQEWPLKTIKRWAASEGVFTLDFGNHAGEYYTCYTDDGERISKLLSGYIELLLKKRQDTGISDDNDVTEVAEEEEIAEALSQHAAATLGTQKLVKVSSSTSDVSIVDVRKEIERTVLEYAKMSPMESDVSAMQQAPKFIADVAGSITMSIADLMSGDKERAKAALQQLGPLLQEFQQSYLAASAQGMGAGVHNLAANDDNLLAACHAMNQSVTKLLGSQQAIDASMGLTSASEGSFDPAVFAVRAAAVAVASQARAEYMNPVETQKLLHELAHNVQFAGREVCRAVEACGTGDAELQALEQNLVSFGDEMTKLIKLIAPTAAEAQSQELIAEMANYVKGTVAAIVEVSRKKYGPDSKNSQQLWAAAEAVTNAIGQLLQASQTQGIACNEQAIQLFTAAHEIVSRLGVFIDPRADVEEVQAAMKGVREGFMILVQATKTVAAHDPNRKKMIVQAAKGLIDAIKALEATVHDGAAPESEAMTTALDTVRVAVGTMIDAAGYSELGNSLKAVLIGSVAKTALASVFSLRSQALAAVPFLASDPRAQEALSTAATDLGPAADEFLAVLISPLDQQESIIINAVTQFLPEATALVCEALTALPSVADKNQKRLLSQQAHAASDALKTLARINSAYTPHGCVALAEEIGPISDELGKIAEALEALEKRSRLTVRIDGSEAVGGEQVRETAFRTLNAASRAVASSIAKLATLPIDELPLEADTILKAVRRIAAAVKGLSATTGNQGRRNALVEAAAAFCRSVCDLNQALMTDREAIAAAGPKVNEAMAVLLEAGRDIVVKEMEEQQQEKAKVVEDVAERELLGAASVIKAAMAKLMAAQSAARKEASAKGITLDEAGVSEEIVEAARVVVASSGDLLARATEAQRELTGSDQGGEKKRSMYQADPKWEQGLISAAKAVAGSVQFLVKAANDHMRGSTSEYAIIAGAKTVAANAAQLQASTKAKLPLDSPRLIAVTSASGAVSSASTSLVTAATSHAQSARAAEEEAELAQICAKAAHSRETQLKIMQMEAQMAVNDLEKQIQEIHRTLAKLRRERYEAAYAKYMARNGGAEGANANAGADGAKPQQKGQAPPHQKKQQQQQQQRGGPAAASRPVVVGMPARAKAPPRGMPPRGMAPRGGMAPGMPPRGPAAPRGGMPPRGMPPRGMAHPPPPGPGAHPPIGGAIPPPPPSQTTAAMQADINILTQQAGILGNM